MPCATSSALGVKEELVARVLDWSGAHCAAALLEGLLWEGTWLSRTDEYTVRQRRKSFGVRDFAQTETLRFEPLSRLAHLTPEFRTPGCPSLWRRPSVVSARLEVPPRICPVCREPTTPPTTLRESLRTLGKEHLLQSLYQALD